MTQINGLGLYQRKTSTANSIEQLDKDALKANRSAQSVLSQLAVPTTASQSLVGRVETNSAIPSPREHLLAMDPQTLREIDRALDELPSEPNYLIRVQNLIGKILEQFITIAENDRVKKEAQKIEYNKAIKEWGRYTKEMGDRGWRFTWISVIVLAAQFAAPQNDREIISFLAKEGCNNLSNMFNADTQAKQKQVDALGQLAYSEIQAMMNKGSSDSNKQEFISLLEKVNDSLRRAAQAG